MFRRDDSGIEKQLGVIYIAAQLIGGILGALAGIFLTEPASETNSWTANVMPREYITDFDKLTKGNINFGAMISECAGAFVVVLMTMMISSKT